MNLVEIFPVKNRMNESERLLRGETGKTEGWERKRTDPFINFEREKAVKIGLWKTTVEAMSTETPDISLYVCLYLDVC